MIETNVPPSTEAIWEAMVRQAAASANKNFEDVLADLIAGRAQLEITATVRYEPEREKK
jgi:hypothetical protein